MPKRYTTFEFIEKSKMIHGDKYLYDKSLYIGSKNDIVITCRIHGDFTQKPYNHLNGCGCQLCDPTNILGNGNFIKKSNMVHKNAYDYSLVEYIKNDIKVKIICKIHGIFEQKPEAHLRGQGCPKCSNNNRRTTEDFIIISKSIHGDSYDYDLVNYVNKRTKVIIKCKKHGVFEQLPYIHLKGFGCKLCHNSSMETHLMQKLKNMDIDFIKDFRFDECRNKLPLPFDFYLPEKNILIECDGIQHRESIKYFGGKKRLEYQKINDNIKNEFCMKKKLKLLRLKNIKEIDDAFHSIII